MTKMLKSLHSNISQFDVYLLRKYRHYLNENHENYDKFLK
jgi:hypothetical protein